MPRSMLRSPSYRRRYSPSPVGQRYTRRRGRDRSRSPFSNSYSSLWMPEVCVENTETMEPIKNIGGINDTRRRLVCFLCKVKYGVCIRCSHEAMEKCKPPKQLEVEPE